jgi:hypothetical protein
MRRLVIALTALLTITGAVVVAGYLFVFGGAVDREARVAPADSTAYVTLYLTPSTGQRLNLAAVLGKLPGFEDPANLDQKFNDLIQRLFALGGLDYGADLKPWLGDQAAVAISASPGLLADPSGAGSEVLLLVDVKDTAAARAALGRMTRSAGGQATVETYEGVEVATASGGTPLSWAIVDRTLIASQSLDRVHAGIDVAQGRARSLADAPGFADAMRRLPSDFLALGWVNLASAEQATGATLPLAGYTSAAMALVAEPTGLHLVGEAPFDAASADASAKANFALGSEPSSLPDWMPPDTEAELVFFGAEQAFSSIEAGLGSLPGGQDAAQALAQLRGLVALGLGIDLDRDILPLFNRETAVAVQGLSGSTPHGELLLRPSDPGGAADALARIAAGLQARGATPTQEQVGGTTITTVAVPQVGSVSWAVSDGVVVLGLSAADVRAALDAHASGDSLAQAPDYRSTFTLAGTRGGNELYVNLGGLLDAAGSATLGDLSPDVRDILTHIGALGLSFPAHDNRVEFHAMVTVR